MQSRIHLQCRRPGFNPWIRKIPWRREWQPTPVFLPGEFHGQRSLAGCNLLGHKDLDMTEWLTHAYTHAHTHTHIRIILNLSIHMEHFRWYERKRFHFFLQWYTLPRMLLPACLLLCSLAGQSHSLHKIFQMAGACKTYEINCITSHTHTHTRLCVLTGALWWKALPQVSEVNIFWGVFITLFMNIHWRLPTRQWALW